MVTPESKSPGDIEIGRFRYSHNAFLGVLLCLAAAAYVIAAALGHSQATEAGWADKLTAHQMIWAILLVPIAAFGSWALKRAGHKDTALSCALVATGFLVGAFIYTFTL